MIKKIRILGIAPYKGLATLMKQCALQYPEIEFTAYAGSMEQGLTLAKRYSEHYDVIISRANTAKMISQSVHIPVIDIGIGYYDVLRCIKMAQNTGTKFALLGFQSLTVIAKNLCDLLQIHVDIFSFSVCDGRIKEGDVVIFFNYRNDRAKELTIVLTQQDMSEAGMHTIPGLQYYCMTPYDASFKGVHILFDKENVHNTLGEYLSKSHKTQLHIAETEKYAHVTFFFNGGREAPFEGEDRILVPSPKVATYDLKPEMSAYEVKDKLVAAIDENKYDFIVVNYANGDMVGHTGVYSAIEKAVVAIDACVRDTVEAAKANGYEVIIIADHGNADNAENADGTPNTAHSLNPVPFVYVTENKNARVEDGILADVAPSICHIMGLPQPAEMTGHDLLK